MKKALLCLVLLLSQVTAFAFAQAPSSGMQARALSIFPYRTVGIPVIDVDHIITGFTVKEIDEKQCVTTMKESSSELIGFEQAICTPPTLHPAVVIDIDESQCNHVWTLSCVPSSKAHKGDKCKKVCGLDDPKPYTGKEPPWTYGKCYHKEIQCPPTSALVVPAFMTGFNFTPAVPGGSECPAAEVDSIECLTSAAIIEPTYEDVSEEFSYTAEEVAEDANVGENVKIRAIGTTFNYESVRYRFKVVRVSNGVSSTLYQSDFATFTGLGKFITDYDYTFVQNGLHRFVFEVIRPQGTVNKVFSKLIPVK